ncbi:TIGR03643 family protein [Pedobacter terrae]|uniref:TIGR03643 family protein n=1 Tax=Pedobacter terrae TaxID=405671 RepID=A0A1G7VCZ8_9SPHI|nr:TIGR03643 family protein [Pedobacter terrae]SDG57624.1 TIGR03643 family protein [Pedobacter terrae]
MTNIDLLSAVEIDRIIEMAWEDRTTFDAIFIQFGLKHQEVIVLMRKQMKACSFKMWRKRMNNKSTKHAVLKANAISRLNATDKGQFQIIK